ncbi:MAG: hypothetical protein V8T00_01770 [Oscillospiraceae bacterium]
MNASSTALTRCSPRPKKKLTRLLPKSAATLLLNMPSTAYCLACIYAYIGKKVTTVGELQDTLADVKAMMLREPRTNSIFQSGVGTAIAAEMIEACKYVKTDAPYEGTALSRPLRRRGSP